MDILIDIVIWIFKAIFKSLQRDSDAQQNKPQTQLGQTRSNASVSDQRAVDVWRAYRKKQEALEAEFRAKAPK